jgi:DNA modification methylase
MGAAAGGAVPYYRSSSGDVVLYRGDAPAVLRALPAGSVHTVITSPPYWNLRDYQTGGWEGGDPDCEHGVRRWDGPKQTQGAQSGHAGAADKLARAVCGTCGARRVDAQIGLEESPEAYVAALVAVFREVWRVLRDDGTLWLNLGDSYAAHGRMVTDAPPHKDLAAASARHKNGPSVGRVFGFPRKGLMMIPSRVAIALQDAGWTLRSDIIWSKPNPMPESVRDRPTRAHEYVFLLSKGPRYFYDATAIAEATTEPPKRCGKNSRANVDRDQAHGTKKQDAIGLRRYAGFNDRYDFGNPNPTRNRRSVWEIATEPFSGSVQTSRRERVAPGDADGDTKRITSPDCPVHGDRAGRAATGFDGGRAADWSSRTVRSDAGPDLGPLFASAPTGPTPGEGSAAQSSDLPRLPCAPSATGRSNGSRRTDPGSATSPPCTPSDETTGRTGHTSASPASAAPHPDMPESSTSPDGSDARSPGQTLVGTAGKSSRVPPECTCELYREITQETSHFATFPTKLVEPCLLSGTSARGCCPACGAPWVRVVETPQYPKELRARPGDLGVKVGYGDPMVNTTGTGQKMQDWRDAHPPVTTGWRAGCACDAGDPIPAVVLDPFAGACTTGLVARKHGRSFIGIELSEAYCRMARERLGQLALPGWSGAAAGG